jgi:hypothetical protein
MGTICGYGTRHKKCMKNCAGKTLRKRPVTRTGARLGHNIKWVEGNQNSVDLAKVCSLIIEC